jgi:hypothetical protein
MNFTFSLFDGEPFVLLLIINQLGDVDIQLAQKVICADTVFILREIVISIFILMSMVIEELKLPVCAADGSVEKIEL